MIPKKILSAANKAYNNGECRINKDIPDSDRGDGLATFIRNEIIDVCDPDDDQDDQVTASINALMRARDQLDKVIDALGEL